MKATGSSEEQCTPANDDVQLTRAWILVRAKQIQSLAVGRDIVLRAPMTEADRWNVQGRRQAESWRSASIPSNLHALKVSLKIDEEEFRAVASPDRLVAAVGGKHDACRWTLQGPNRYLRLARFRRDINDPAAVR